MFGIVFYLSIFRCHHHPLPWSFDAEALVGLAEAEGVLAGDEGGGG